MGERETEPDNFWCQDEKIWNLKLENTFPPFRLPQTFSRQNFWNPNGLNLKSCDVRSENFSRGKSCQKLAATSQPKPKRAEVELPKAQVESWISFVWKISPWSKTWYSNGCYLKWNGSVLKSSSSSNLCHFANTRCFFIQQFGASLEWIRINNGNTLLVPPIMLACTDFLSTPDCLETEGIFRRSANAALVKELQVTKLDSFYLDVPGQGSSKTD